MSDGNQLAQCRHGRMLYHAKDAVIGRSLAYYGEYFETEVDLFRHYLAAGDVVVDAGANIGSHTLAMARLVGPHGRVLAVEPQRLVFQTLCANMALNDITCVDCHWLALDADDGDLWVPEPDLRGAANHGGVAMSHDAIGQRVDGRALDGLFPYDRLKLLKADVEGMELALILGATETLHRFRPVLYLENDRVDHSPTLLSTLRRLGYDCHWHLPRFHNPDNFNRQTTPLHPCGFTEQGGDRLGSIGFAVNMLCVPTGDAVPDLPGLLAVVGEDEHPYRRHCLPRFAPLVAA